MMPPDWEPPLHEEPMSSTRAAFLAALGMGLFVALVYGAIALAWWLA